MPDNPHGVDALPADHGQVPSLWADYCAATRERDALKEALKEIYNAAAVDPDSAPEWLVRNIVRTVRDGASDALPYCVANAEADWLRDLLRRLQWSGPYGCCPECLH